MPIFDNLDKDEIQAIIKHMYHAKLGPGELVCKEGDTGGYICFVAQGSLDIMKRSDGGGEVVITTLHKGRSLGEMSVIDEYPRSATVKARNEVILFMITRKEFNLILEKYPLIGIKLLKAISRILSQSLRKTSSRLADYMLPLS